VKLYADEAGHEAVRELNTLVVSALARVEVPSALWRKTRTGELGDSAAGLLVRAFEIDFHGDLESTSRFTVVSLSELILAAAAREAARAPLRAYDAVQLACALAVRNLDPLCSRFACFDSDLRRAAAHAGFTLLPETV
jgi:predicted nucleic acid-binding protein